MTRIWTRKHSNKPSMTLRRHRSNGDVRHSCTFRLNGSVSGLTYFHQRRKKWTYGHLDDLVRRVVRGEAIDPPLVMMIGEQWVCFEGHDRIAAYRTLEPKQTIKCEWFDGTVHEACR